MVVEPDLLDPEILFNCVCTLGVLYTHSPYLGVRSSAPKKGVWGQHPREQNLGCVLTNSIADPWYWVNPRIFPLYFPYKRKHCKTTVYAIVLYWKRECESVKRKCSGLATGCIPSYFWTIIKGLSIYLCT